MLVPHGGLRSWNLFVRLRKNVSEIEKKKKKAERKVEAKKKKERKKEERKKKKRRERMSVNKANTRGFCSLFFYFPSNSNMPHYVLRPWLPDYYCQSSFVFFGRCLIFSVKPIASVSSALHFFRASRAIPMPSMRCPFFLLNAQFSPLLFFFFLTLCHI